MTLTLTFLGHSGFAFQDGRHTLLLDPFLTGNPAARHTPGDLACDYIALTHGHSDHLGDTVALARSNDATVIGVFELCNYLGERGVAKTDPANPGGKITTGFGWVALTQAFHSSSYEGRYLGMPCGLVVSMGGAVVYHCGDTGLFGDMRLIGEVYRPDLALIPIGDRYTMGPELATRAAELINPKVAIPIHFNTWPPIAQDPKAFAPRGIRVRVLEPGATWTVGGDA
jgi:L-ascorbate metabolism protein UlaG (beta-lactamase superfamily)